MAKVWVQAITALHYENQGVHCTAEPGEWVNVGKHQARQWLASGQAVIPKPATRAKVEEYGLCGVRVRVPLVASADWGAQIDEDTDKAAFGDLADKLTFTWGEPAITHDYTIIWKPPAPVIPAAAKVGLARLHSFEGTDAEPWEMLAMLASETKWANGFGSREERDKTEAAIGDLRVPVYNTALLWVRRTERTEAVVARWVAELREGADERHAFLRALYAERVLMCTVNMDWQRKYVEWK